MSKPDTFQLKTLVADKEAQSTPSLALSSAESHIHDMCSPFCFLPTTVHNPVWTDNLVPVQPEGVLSALLAMQMHKEGLSPSHLP